MLRDKNSAVRYWAVTGILMRGEKALLKTQALRLDIPPEKHFFSPSRHGKIIPGRQKILVIMPCRIAFILKPTLPCRLPWSWAQWYRKIGGYAFSYLSQS